MSRTNSDAPGRQRAAHLGPALRRPLVLDAALRVWDRLGYARTTMASIAEEAGVSKPVLYECFPTKEATLLALLEREERRLVSDSLAALPLRLDPQDQLGDVARIFVGMFRSVLAHPVPWRVFLEGRDVPAMVAARMQTARAGVIEHIATLLEQLAGAQHREVPRREAVVRAAALVSLVEGNAVVLLHQKPGPDAWEIEDLADLLARIVVEGWGSTAPQAG